MTEPPRSYDLTRPFSIGIWGDSHSAAGYMTDEISRALNRGVREPSFIPNTTGVSGVRTPQVNFCRSGLWSYKFAYRSKEKGPFPVSLAALTSNEPGSVYSLDFRREKGVSGIKSVTALIASLEESAIVGISADQGQERLVSIDRGAEEAIRIIADHTISVLKIRLVVGAISIDGFIPEYIAPSLLHIDTYGIPGATLEGWNYLDDAYFKARAGGIDYDLVIFQYGTNEGNNPNFNPESYKERLTLALTTFRRIYPQASCILIGAPDRGLPAAKPVKKKSGKARSAARPLPQDPRKYSRIHASINAIQSAVGGSFGCSAWDWQAGMGGEGSAQEWLNGNVPLMAQDLIHLSKEGYRLSARKFINGEAFQSVLKNFVTPDHGREDHF